VIERTTYCAARQWIRVPYQMGLLVPSIQWHAFWNLWTTLVSLVDCHAGTQSFFDPRANNYFLLKSSSLRPLLSLSPVFPARALKLSPHRRKWYCIVVYLRSFSNFVLIFLIYFAGIIVSIINLMSVKELLSVLNYCWVLKLEINVGGKK
jgi:hypothetical protein